MTGRGWLFGGVGLLLAVTGYVTGIWGISLLAAALLGVWVLAGLSVGAAALTLRDDQRPDDRVVRRGDNASLTVAVSGVCLFPVQVRWTTSSVKGEEPAAYEVLCGIGRRRAAGKLTFVCPHVGAVPGYAAVAVYDVCGFFCRRPRLTALPEIEVWPCVWPIDLPFSVLDDRRIGERMAGVSDEGDALTDTRAYREGDSLKQIHWKMSVRRREWYTKQYEQTGRWQITLWVDVAHPVDRPEEYADAVCEAAASIGRQLLTQGADVALAAGERMLASVRAGDDPQALYRALSGIDWNASAGAPKQEQLDGLVIAVGGGRKGFDDYVKNRFGDRGRVISVWPRRDRDDSAATVWHWPQDIVRDTGHTVN